ncbi:MAG: hypothetical protein ISQ13_01290 [Candidatus Margulisbacteria bacterium]|nr:hypothetical protein [Candidatus Margulisiibacteriota bacterium]
MAHFFLILLVALPLFGQSFTVEIEELPTTNLNQTTTKKPSVLMVDDFEDNDLVTFREWWSFGKVMINTKKVTEEKPYLGETSMIINGSSYNWYAGGIGTYLNEDAQHFTTLKLVIYSPKLNAGAIRIELYDDDNNNNVVDIDSDKQMPSKDDLLIYDLNLIWKGWKVVSIPLIDFVDFNPEIGDNIWNPNQLYGSGGLIQMQLVVLSSKYKSETIEFEIDTIKFN